MTNVSVSCSKLADYGSFLESKSTEFKTITSKMEEIVAGLGSGWSGSDADNFRTNATAYLKNLKNIETSLVYYGNFIKGKSINYNNICANFYDILTR